MANRQNIQMLFDEMTADHVVAYMKNNGWDLSESQNPAVTAFEIGPEEDHKRIWIWASSAHPKFRSRVQNLVFSLAVQNEVEPIEIANAIVDTKIERNDEPSSSPETSTSGNGRFEVVLHNNGDTTELMLEGAWGNTCALYGGERFTVMGEDLAKSPEISFGGSRISIVSSSPERIRVFCIGPSLENGSRDADFIRNTVEVAFGKFKIADTQSLMRSLGAAFERAEFELSDVSASPGFERFVLKSVAFLLASIVQVLPESEGKQSLLLWFICNHVLSDLQLALELFPECQQQLWHSAESDEPSSPKATFDWLSDRVIVKI